MSPITCSLTLLVLLLTWAAKSTAQQPFEIPNVEYPTLPCELRNEHRVFLQAPLSTRKEIVKELLRYDGIIIAERPEDADYFLLFAYSPVVMAETAGAAGYAEMTAVKFIRSRKDQVRPRILFYWQGKKTSRSVPLAFNGGAANGFSLPRSTRSAVEELIGKIAGWALTKKWHETFHFDPFTNQLTISTGGKFETSGAKAFIKELKNARGDSYAQKCATSLLPAGIFPAQPPLWLDAPNTPPVVLSPTVPVKRGGVRSPSQTRQRSGSARRRSFKHSKKGHGDR